MSLQLKIGTSSVYMWVSYYVMFTFIYFIRSVYCVSIRYCEEKKLKACYKSVKKNWTNPLRDNLKKLRWMAKWTNNCFH